MTTRTLRARWCHDRVVGRGQCDRHVAPRPRQRGVMDQADKYFVRHEAGNERPRVLYAIGNIYHRPLAFWSERRGIRSEYATVAELGFCRSLGLQHVIVQYGLETVAVDVTRGVCSQFTGATASTTRRMWRAGELTASAQRSYKVPLDISHVMHL